MNLGGYSLHLIKWTLYHYRQGKWINKHKDIFMSLHLTHFLPLSALIPCVQQGYVQDIRHSCAHTLPEMYIYFTASSQIDLFIWWCLLKCKLKFCRPLAEHTESHMTMKMYLMAFVQTVLGEGELNILYCNHSNIWYTTMSIKFRNTNM